MPGRRRWTPDKQFNFLKERSWFVVSDMTSYVVSWMNIPPRTDLTPLFEQSLAIGRNAGWTIEEHTDGMRSVFCHRDRLRRHLHICLTYPANPISGHLPPCADSLEDCIAQANQDASSSDSSVSVTKSLADVSYSLMCLSSEAVR